jgi:hypothetical protein
MPPLVQGSDQRRNGTQDVNDPASGPEMRPRGPFGVVHVLGSECRSHGTPRGDKRAAHSARHAAGYLAVTMNV